MEIFVIYAVGLFVAYLITAIKLFGIPRSISDTFYLYEGMSKHLGYVFTGFMFATATLIVTPMVELGSFEWWQFLGFLCPVGIAFCGSAPLFKDDKDTKIVHCTGAVTGVLSGLSWCFLVDTRTAFIVTSAMVSASIIASVATKTEKSCFTFWAEMAGFGTIAVVLLIQTIGY